MRPPSIIYLLLMASLSVGCKKSSSSPPTETPSEAPGEVGKIIAYAEPGMSGCDHGTESMAIARHAWPYPADSRNVRWGDKYQRMKLKLNTKASSFFTATVTWKKGEFIEVLDSEMIIRKPRQVVAKHDMYVTRKIWDQGVEVKRVSRAVAAGDVASFLFYNSRGLCLIQTEQGPEWTKCSLEDSFEGVTAEQPFACEQTWWIKVSKGRLDKGWMPFEPALMVRLPPPDDATR